MSSPAAAAAGPLNPPPGFDPSCKAGVFLEANYCYNRFNSTRVSRFCYDRDKCGAAPQRWEIERFRDSLKACMQASTGRLGCCWAPGRAARLRGCAVACGIV